MPQKNKISRSDWPDILASHSQGQSYAEIARNYGVSGPAISYIVRAARDAGLSANSSAADVAEQTSPAEGLQVGEATDATSENPGTEDTAAPRRRGRPPKKATLTPVSETGETPVKRGPGRPRKVVPQEPSGELGVSPETGTQPDEHTAIPTEPETGTSAPLTADDEQPQVAQTTDIQDDENMPRAQTLEAQPQSVPRPSAAVGDKPSSRGTLSLVRRKEAHPESLPEQPQEKSAAKQSAGNLSDGGPVVEAAVILARAYEEWLKNPDSEHYNSLDQALDMVRHRTADIEIAMLTR